MTFYNTIEETGEELAESCAKAFTQEEAIYSLFATTQEELSPSMVHEILELKCPITSVRRAMSNLTNKGLISKTNQYVEGTYGKREHLWAINTEFCL